MKSENEVVSGVRDCAVWWVEQRQKKLEQQLHETMSVNPFLMPFLFDYHNLGSFSQLAELIIASHLMVGHNTGFGKLIDEKVLPKVFGAQKLDAKFRRENRPFQEACFDEIDHVIERDDGTRDLLSLKAGKWTIQLTMAVQLNTAFSEILRNHPESADRICVGVFYGKQSELTDKYDILRGINRGANHNVIDCSEQVEVYAGKEFWSWLNGGIDQTQNWVMKGILEALSACQIKDSAEEMLMQFTESVEALYSSAKNDEGNGDWQALLAQVNG